MTTDHVDTATGELVPIEEHHPAPLNLFGATTPAEVISQASDTAVALADVIENRKLFHVISGKRHVTVEGWTLLGSMLGVFPVTEWTRELTDDSGRVIGWEARVEARTRAGETVGAAEASCMKAEKRWGRADDYAIRSMAQTRATSKAMRMPLGFIIELAGYAATPADEMPDQPDSGAAPQGGGYGTDEPAPPATGRTWQEAFMHTVRRHCDEVLGGEVDHDQLRYALVAYATDGECERTSDCTDADRPALLEAWKALKAGTLAIQTDGQGTVVLVEQG